MGTCAEKDCGNFYKDHKWGHIRAHDEGWFFSKEDRLLDDEIVNSHLDEVVRSNR